MVENTEKLEAQLKMLEVRKTMYHRVVLKSLNKIM